MRNERSNLMIGNIEKTNDQPLSFYLGLNNYLDRTCIRCEHRISDNELVRKENEKFYHSNCEVREPLNPRIRHEHPNNQSILNDSSIIIDCNYKSGDETVNEP